MSAFPKPETVDITFYSTLVLREAVARSYPGGLLAFERRFQPAQSTRALAKLVRMSVGDTEHLLGELNAAGLVPGVDVAVADMMQGPLLECPEIIIEGEDDLLGRWLASACGGPPDQPETPPGDEWIMLATREACGMVDTWDEVLQALPVAGGWELQVFMNEPLGDVPSDWYDEDGELLPEHQDADGELRVPVTFNGKSVTGYTFDGFLGPLMAVEHAARLTTRTSEEIEAALTALGWPLSDLAAVSATLAASEPSATPINAPEPAPSVPRPPEATEGSGPAGGNYRGPRRVIFGSGPVHYLYDDEEEGEE